MSIDFDTWVCIPHAAASFTWGIRAESLVFDPVVTEPIPIRHSPWQSHAGIDQRGYYFQVQYSDAVLLTLLGLAEISAPPRDLIR